MSRRKQSVPCKVGGSDEVPLTYNQPVVSIAPLSKYNISPNTSITDLKAESQSLTDLNSLMSPSQNDKEGVSTVVNHTEQEMDAEDLNDFDSKDSLDNSSISTEMATKEELDAQLSSALLSYKQTNSSEPCKNKQRFSARIRAKVQLKALSLSPPGNGPKTILLSRPLQQDLDADKVQAAKSELRQRNLSYEEELTCPICYKTFMSKYGLLTHTEVHATPELKCTMCNLAFSRRSAFVAHQIHCHADDYGDDELYQTHNFTPPTPRQRSNGATGFGDLSLIDFTCSKFPDIAGNLCVKSKHRLSDRDRRHFFMCKKCNALFPTLLVLERHVAKHHVRNSSNSSGTTPKLTILGKTYIINSDMAAAATAAVVVDSAVDGDKTSPNSAVAAAISSTALSSPADTRGFMDALNLKSTAAAAVLVAAKGSSGDKSEQCSYGTDNDLIRTSPLIAFLNVPQWLRSSNAQQNWTAAGVVPEDQERPPLRLKLLRCKSTGSEESSGELKLLRSVDSYLVNSSSAAAAVSKTLAAHACSVCGEGFASQRAVESHRAGSACGIGVRSSSNGRKMFWCRLCNYASFEKSTIMRHQRTHTGIRPYSCKFCHLAFTTKANCERHVRKRHIAQVPNEADVKEAVECDEELLKKARSGGSEFKPYQAKSGLITSPEQHLFKCRLCKSVFTTRSNGARHVMDKHHIYSRKGANEMVTFLQQNRIEPRHRPIAPALGITPDDGTVHFVSKRNLDRSHHQHQQSQATLFRGKKRRPELTNEPLPPAKIPRLIPLSKIEAYHDSSQKLARHFRSNYAEVLDNLGVSESGKRVNDIRRMSSTLVSLLASTSALLLENNAPTPTASGGRAHHRARYRSGDISNRYASLHPNLTGASHGRARSAASVAASLQSYVKTANANPPPMKRTQWASSNRVASQKKVAISRPPANSTSYHELVQLYADGKWDGDEQDKTLDTGGFPSASDVLQLTAAAAGKETGDRTAERHSSSSSHDSNPIPIRKQIKLELLANNPTSQALQLRQAHRAGQQAAAKGTTSPDLASIKRLVDFVHQPGPLVQNGVRGSPPQDGVHIRDDDTSPLGGDTRGKYRMVALKPKTNESSKSNSGLTWKFIPYPPETRDEKGRYMKDPEKKRSSLGSHDGFSPFLADVSRPTMVAIPRGPARTPSGFASRSHFGEKNLCLRSRKCPKCNKTFPWASSLRRHIMTHTGLKPYMCARCSMRFTTRSNLLRHAYRRHAVARGSEEQRKVLITLTRKEQEERASIEAEEHGARQGGVVEEEEDEVPEAPLVMDTEEFVSDNDHDEGLPLVETQPKVETSKVTEMIDISNKRFMCGLCNVPFANRSNVVRHLHRLHSITKDDHNFRQLLVKIDHSNPPRLVESTRFATPRVTLHKALPVLPAPPVVETPKEAEPIEVKPQPVPKANKEEPPAAPEPAPTTPSKAKPFKCTICSIGFTKRNNAARHVHQQHHISKHRANFANLIEKVDSSPERTDAPDSPTTPREQQEPGEKSTPGGAEETQPKDQEPKQGESAEEEKPDSNQLAKAIEVVVGVSSLPPSPLAKTPPPPPAPAPPAVAPAPIQPPTGHVWRSRRMSAKRRLEAGETPEPIPPPPKVEPKQSSKSTQFVCGVCKRIFKLVEELKEHLEEHNIPHPWHCPLCGVPFTNKYNCQRHLTRRHGETSMEPKYVEDVRHGPRHPRKRSRRTM